MYFKKLEILGFKSFAEKTALHFEPGITAVVGPNGCGKSNIFDSIRWVLGEQSVKSLRGSKMEDVIFNGTESLPALGYAEVSLTFSNETKALPIDYSEVTVTRRLFRSGESEYLINKTQVRLKDIVELFMGTGIGAESYSLIEQGKIDLILSSRPEERRLVFDEAAGISKYKSQKRETIRRLEDTEANLLRISDIIAEVKRQINSLERQAAKARRYKEVFERLKGLEINLAFCQLKEFDIQLEQGNSELNQFIYQQTQDAQSIEQLQKEQETIQQELNTLDLGLSNLRAQENTLANTIDHDTQQLGFNGERIEELKKRLEAIGIQKQELQVKIAHDEEKISNFKASLDILLNEVREKESQEALSKNDLEKVAQEISTAQNSLKEAKAKVMEFAAGEASLHNQLKGFTGELNQAIARKKRLDIEKQKAEEELTQVSQNLGSAQEALNLAFTTFTSHTQASERLKADYANCLRDKETLNARLQCLENDKAALESQKEFLSNLKLRYENISESSNATILLDDLTDEKISGIIFKVEEVKKTDEARYVLKGVAKPISLDPQEVINKIELLSQEILQAKDQASLIAQRMGELSRELEASEKSLRESELEYNTCKNKKDNISQHANKLKDEFEVISFEAAEVSQQLDKLSGEEKRLNESILKIKEDAQSNQQAIDQNIAEIEQRNILREKILLKRTQLNAEIIACREKISGYEENSKMLEESYLKNKNSFDSLFQEESNAQKRIQELETSSTSLEKGIERHKEQKMLLGQEIAKDSGFFVELKNKMSTQQEALLERKNALDTLKAKVHQLEMQLQEVSFHQNALCERMQQVYKATQEEIRNCVNPDFDHIGASEEIMTLKQKIESYGQVNLVAIEEFDELKQRYDFLTNQQLDLLKSKEALHEAILKINRTTKKMFLDTFEKLAVEFKNYFRLLFGGGDAQLFLLDEHDVLESGIEIACRPPGKKLQNVLLLSGGEKSMSAIALLFAIFKVKPSPFCVLDEIDAALDEANVDKFSRMLKDFTAQSQFIVITHNKKTIATANIMYGITMEKAGISKIVSVKLAETKEEQKQEERPPQEEKPQTQESILEATSPFSQDA